MDPSKFFRDGIISADGTLKYYYNLSLKNAVSVRIVRNLWMNEKERFINGYHKDHAFGQNDGWEDLEDCVLAKIKQLPLPQITIKQLLCVVEFVGNEIRNWIYFQVYHVLKAGKQVGCGSDDYDLTSIFIRDMDCLEWAHHGMIDAVKTATSLLKKTELDDEQKYVLSCIYCLKDRLKSFPPSVMKKFLHAFVEGDLDIDDAPLVYYWTYQLMNHPSIRLEMFENGELTIEWTVLDEISGYFDVCQDVACKFLWNKLSNIEKSQKFLHVMQGRSSTFKYWLLSSLNYEQQKEFFKSHFVVEFLIGMLCDWNFVDCFLPTCYHIIDDLNIDKYVILFKMFCCEMGDCHKRGDKFCKIEFYNTIFRTLWKHIPVPLQKQLIEMKLPVVNLV